MPDEITVQLDAARFEAVCGAVDFALEDYARMYRNPTPEDEAAYDDIDRDMRAMYLALAYLAERLLAADMAHKQQKGEADA